MHIIASDLAKLVASGQAPCLLDVRSRREFVRGHLPGAAHVPFWRLALRLSSIPQPRDEPLVVYCGHGPRAWVAALALRASGFRRVHCLAGHMTAWRRAGYPEAR